MLASLDDLIAVGAIPANADSALKARGLRLLELASAQVCAFLSTTEAVLRTAVTAEQLTSMAAIVAECAGSRINRSLAQSSDAFTGTGYESALLNKWHKAQLVELIGLAGRGSASVTVDRDSDSSFLDSGWSVSPYYPLFDRTFIDLP
jgi:hypothetical protein